MGGPVVVDEEVLGPAAVVARHLRPVAAVERDDPATLAAHLGLPGADFQIDPDADPELAAALIRLADRFRAAVPTR